MKILITAATKAEIQPLLDDLFPVTYYTVLTTASDSFKKAHRKGLSIDVLITGPGMIATAFHLGKALAQAHYDLVINAGIAGSYRLDWELGMVVAVETEQIADFGVEDADGQFTSVFDIGLIGAHTFPFVGKKIHNKFPTSHTDLKIANGLTVNKVHGNAVTIKKAREIYKADIETMEGAAFFYACRSMNCQFTAIRSISNYVEPRNKDNWDIPLAIKELNTVLLKMLEKMENS